MDLVNHINLGLIWLAASAAFAVGAGIGALANRLRHGADGTTRQDRKEQP
ncbi:hypothetical protein ACIQNU_04005 [Streptomyces sp. NPDC091292]